MHQRKLVWPVVVPLACCLSGSPAPGGPQSTTYDCVANEPDERIAGCTQIINSGRARPRDRATAFYRRGQAYFQKEAYDRAIADFTSAIRLDPKDARVFNARGLAYREKDNPDAAIADFTSAIRLDPKNVRVYNHRGVAHGDKADFDRAIADYSAAIRLVPKYSIAYFNRAKEYRDYGQLERAIADLTMVIRLDPKDDDAYHERGNAYRDKGDDDAAIADLSTAIELDSEDGEVFIDRGNARRDRAEYELAVADYNSAIKLDTKDIDARRQRGIAFLYAGSPAKAHAELNEAHQLSPQNPYVALWLEIAARRDNRPRSFREIASAIHMVSWPAPLIRLFLDEIGPEALLAAANDPKLRRKRQQVCEANFYMGQLALARHGAEEAAILFRRVTSECPRSLNEWGAAVAELKALGLAR